MVLCFFDDGPHEKDTRGSRPNMFKTGMKDAPCADPLVCCAGGLCIPCANCYFRAAAASSDTSRESRLDVEPIDDSLANVSRAVSPLEGHFLRYLRYA